jgi:hypothetical protein
MNNAVGWLRQPRWQATLHVKIRTEIKYDGNVTMKPGQKMSLVPESLLSVYS